MKMPWAKEVPVFVPPPRSISDADMAARLAAYEEVLRERAERTMSVPRNLDGWRLADGCTCGAQAAAEARYGKDMRYWPSAGVHHADECELMRAIMIQIIEAR